MSELTSKQTHGPLNRSAAAESFRNQAWPSPWVSGGAFAPEAGIKNEALFCSLHEQIGTRFMVELQSLVKRSIGCELVDVCTKSHAALLLDAEEPAAVVLAEADTAEKRVAWYCSPTATSCFLEAVLGGSVSQVMPLDRPLTEIEAGLMVRLADVLWEQLATLWSQMAALQFETQRIESAMKRVRIAPATSQVLVVTWNVFEGIPNSTMQLIYPWSLVEPFLERLEQDASSPGDRPPHTKYSGASPAKMSIEWASTTLSAEELQGLQVGDVLVTEAGPQAWARLFLDRNCAFEGTIGDVRGQLSLRIERDLRKS